MRIRVDDQSDGGASSLSGWQRRALGVFLIGAFLAAWTSVPAHAEFGITSFDGSVENQDGSAATQAGSHPYAASTTIRFNAVGSGFNAVPDGDVKDVHVALPPGLVGNPTAVPTCSEAQLGALIASQLGGDACPQSSQVGLATVTLAFGDFTVPIYNLEPPESAPAAFGFSVLGVPVRLLASVRSGTDYGLTVDVPDISQALPILGTSVRFWGVPAAHEHDIQRCAILSNAVPPVCDGTFGPSSEPHVSDAPPIPFLTNPTACTPVGVGLETRLSATSWIDPAAVVSSSFASHRPAPDDGQRVGPEGCDRLRFDPRIKVRPTSSSAGVPTGLSVQLEMPQDGLLNRDGLAQAHLKRASVTLPKGVSLSPSAAKGLTGCPSADAALDSAADTSCSSSSKVGVVRIDTPLLAAPLTGAIYLARPFDNPFRSLVAIYLVARGSGLVIKLPGQVSLDSQSGQVTASFDNNPQLPFTRLSLDFFGGADASLVNPPSCGRYVVTSEMASWGGQVASPQSSFDIDGGSCGPATFSPQFSASSLRPVAGADTQFVLSFSRGDADEPIRSISALLPRGLVGRISTTDLCNEMNAALGSCPGTARIGSVTTTAGPGPQPFSLPGRAYITGPYAGAPFGLSIVVPAVAGPFDLGTVVVRSAVFVDRRTAQLRVVADPLPTILSGIPLQIRSVKVSIDRTRFMINPTNCTSSSVEGAIDSTRGSIAPVASRFQVGDCARLAYRPQLSLTVGRRGRTGERKRIPFTAVLTQRAGEANNESVSVRLPLTINSLLSGLRNLCKREDFAQARCSSRTRVGTATATTPLLRDPLTGTVYIVRHPRGRIPILMMTLRGQVSVDLAGVITISRSRYLVTTFAGIPDVPISRFRLSVGDGANALLGTTADLCSSAARAERAAVTFTGQNGRTLRRSSRLRVSGCGRRVG